MAVSSAIVVTAGLIPATSGFATASSSATTLAKVTYLGTTSLAAGNGTAVDGTTNEIIPVSYTHLTLPTKA